MFWLFDAADKIIILYYNVQNIPNTSMWCPSLKQVKIAQSSTKPPCCKSSNSEFKMKQNSIRILTYVIFFAAGVQIQQFDTLSGDLFLGTHFIGFSTLASLRPVRNDLWPSKRCHEPDCTYDNQSPV